MWSPCSALVLSNLPNLFVGNMPEPVSFDTDQLIRVDEQDCQTGLVEKKAAHMGAGVLHRAFSVFLFNSKGELLLQQRAPAKMLWGGYWSNSVCSHPRAGEEILHAAKRRVQQELGMVAPELTWVYAFTYHVPFKDIGSEYEYCHVLVGRSDEPPQPHPDEISGWRWVNCAELKQEVTQNPDQFTPWFKMEIEELSKRGFFPPESL